MKDLSIPMARMHLLAIPFLLVSGMLVAPYGLVWGWHSVTSGFNQFFKLINFIPTMLLGIILHEGLHGLGWKYAAKLRWDDMRYGMQWKSLTPYAHSKEPMRKSPYVIGSLLPGVLLGIIPYTVALAIGHGWLMLFGVVFTFTAAGDFWSVYTLRKAHPDAWVQDHSENVGCIVYEDDPKGPS